MFNNLQEKQIIAIIGGGASGVLVAIQLLQQAKLLENSGKTREIILFEQTPEYGLGMAYRTPFSEHILNVPAGKMSAFPDQPNHFVDYLKRSHLNDYVEFHLEEQFVQRRHWGEYLKSCLAEIQLDSNEKLIIKTEKIIDLDYIFHQENNSFYTQLYLENGEGIRVDSVVFATGNSPRHLPFNHHSEIFRHTESSQLSEKSPTSENSQQFEKSLRPENSQLSESFQHTESSLPSESSQHAESFQPTKISQNNLNRCVNAWDYQAIHAIPNNADIAIIGSGLSMVDSVLSLSKKNHTGQIMSISRHGLLPLPHSDKHSAAPFQASDLFSLNLKQRVTFLRKKIKELANESYEWQQAMDTLRPHVQTLWKTLSFEDQRLFLRYIVRYWDIHRHRIAAPVHQLLLSLIENEKLKIVKGKVIAAGFIQNNIENNKITIQLNNNQEIQVDYIINSTGIETQLYKTNTVLLKNALKKHLIQAGNHGLGIATHETGRIICPNNINPPWFCIGILRIGELWETIAIPDLRQEAERLAREIAKNLT